MTVGPPQVLPEVVRPVTQEQISRYADVSGDHNPLHLDPEFAARTPFGRTVAHGMLVMAFLSEMLASAFGTAWVTGGKLRVRFRAPVFPGDTITTKGALREQGAETGKARYDVACTNQSAQDVITGEATVSWPAERT